MLYNYSQAKGRLVTETGAVNSDRPPIRFATKPTWTIRFCDVGADAVTALDVSDAVAWRAAVDCDHRIGTEPMCRTLNDDIDHSAAVSGEISIPLDANTETFLAAVDGKESLSSWFELWGLDGNGEAIYYVKFPIWTGMTIDPVSGEIPPAPVGQWADKTYLEARLAAGYEIELSNDGLAWYALDLDGEGAPIMPDTAAWWHYRNKLIGGEWSDVIPLLRGPQGMRGTGLSFATLPEYSAEIEYQQSPDDGYNVCTDQGGIWLYINATPGSGNAPPILPEISNDYWSLIVAPGGTPEIDDAPTENSENLITSGAVYAALGDIQSILETL